MTISTRNSLAARFAATAVSCLCLVACQQDSSPMANDVSQAPAGTDVAGDEIVSGSDAGRQEQKEAKKSIIRPDIEPTPTPSVAPAELTISFPAKGNRPDPAGMALLDTLFANPVLSLGGAITIWGHSDSSGSDVANLLMSRRRAEAVRDYLVTKGVAAERISVVALGEARPIAPNRKLNGSDDPEGRAKNRRVEIKVNLPNPGSGLVAEE